jgi:signal peptidase II
MSQSDSQSRTALLWIWIALLVVVLDQYTKYWVSQHFQLHEALDVLPSLRLLHEHNTGAAFSLLAESPKVALYFFSSISALVIMGLLAWLFTLSASSRWVAVSVSLVLGGAVGNLIDRVRFGYVIDFIDVYVNQWHWPVFNVADMAICVGAVMLVIDVMFLSRDKGS